MIAAVVAGAAAVIGALGGGDMPTYVPRDASLREAGLYFYPAAPSTGAPRAFVFFFGNDIGFWRAHRQLAADLAGQGYAVVGFDMKPLLRRLPEETGARDSTFRAIIVPLVLRARRELAPSARPALRIVLAGHSLGAEVALWTAAHAGLPDVAGVLALSPGSRSHLRVSASDLLMTGEPTGPASFSVAGVVARVTAAPGVRIAIVRGSHDPLRSADSALLAAGGQGIRRFLVPLAGHALKQVALARYVVREGLTWVLERDARAPRQRGLGRV